MKVVFRIFFWMAGSFLALVALALVLGLFLPRDHRVARRLRLKAAPDQVWALLTDHARDPSWRSHLRATVRQADRHGHPVWADAYANGQQVAYETTEQVEGRRLVRVIVDQEGFGGTWTFELQPEGGGTRLTLTEEGWVKVPYRAMAKFVLGHASVMEQYLRDVARRFGEAAAPEPA